jgi:hypothetical protein
MKARRILLSAGIDMILGQSIFDAVVDRLREEDETLLPENRQAWTGIRGLNAGFVGADQTGDNWTDSNRVNQAYSAFDDDTPVSPNILPDTEQQDAEEPAPSTDADVARYARLSPQEIAEDMGLSTSDTPADLQAKRRTFARANHPDLVPSVWRDEATTRMKIANLLIDEALKQAMLRPS